MRPLPTTIADTNLDLHGCEYHESQQLTHIDGFLVSYNGHGRLTLSADLSDQEKLHGARRLLDQLEQTVAGEPQLFFWTRDDRADTLASGQAPGLAASPPGQSPDAPPAARVAAADVAAPAQRMAPPGAARALRFSLLHVPRVIIHTAARTIANQPRVRRGADQEQHTLVEDDTPSGHYASLSLRKLNSLSWSLLVQIEPPAPGHIRATIGAHSFQAALTASGAALLDAIPPALLLDADGPDLELCLEQLVTDELP